MKSAMEDPLAKGTFRVGKRQCASSDGWGLTLSISTIGNLRVFGLRLLHTRQRFAFVKRDLDVVRQKNALQALLQRRFGVVISEKAFDWLRVPGQNQFDGRYSRIAEALHEHRGAQEFFKRGTRLIADFFVEALNLVIEYDERQHFTRPRRITLDHYPSDLAVGFSVAEWQQACDQTRAVDSDAKRDETRVFYDTVRDFEIIRHGLKIIRIRHGALDWEGPEAGAALTALLSPLFGEAVCWSNNENRAVSTLGNHFGTRCIEYRP